MENSTFAEPVAENLMTLSQWIENRKQYFERMQQSSVDPLEKAVWAGSIATIMELEYYLESRQDTEFTGYDIFGPAR